MWLFGDFGYDPLISEYEKDHPNVTIKTKIAEYNDHHDALTAALAAGSGAPDIAAVEVGYISAFKAQPQNFYNLLDFGASEIKDDYLDWKWEQALTGDGSALIGLPTDVGGMAMAYRWDLFKKAGLPYKRDDVSASWPTWEDFIAEGKQFTDETGTPFIDEGSQLYNAIVNQSDEKYYEPDDSLIYDSNPQVKKAWDLTTRAIGEGIVANIEPFAAEWNTAMNKGDFAVLTAPAWMMGYIQDQAPDTKGKWDIASLPEGGGNWGGSHLTLPAQGEHPREAYDFIKWLLAPEQQLKVFQNTGNFPSTPATYDEPPIQNFHNGFFNNAPVGPIYAENAMEVTPVYEGPQEGAIRLGFENALDRVEDGKESPDAAWRSALEEIQREVSS
jgi:cellobiose transport system substrate-binding protein